MASYVVQFILSCLIAMVLIEVVLMVPAHLDDAPSAPPPPPTSQRLVAGDKESLTSKSKAAPSQVMRRVHLVESKDRAQEWELWSEEASGFNSGKRWKLDIVRVRFFGRNGTDFIVNGKTGFVDVKKKNMSIKGEVNAKSSTGVRFVSEAVEYVSSSRLLISPEPVKVWMPPDARDKNFYVEGQKLVANLDENTVVVESKVVSKRIVKPGETMIIYSDQAQFNTEKNTAEYFGNVRIQYQGLNLAGPNARFIYNSKAKAIDELIMTSGVRAYDQQKVATAQTLRADLGFNRIVFSGNPRVVQNQDELLGEQIIFLDRGDQIKIKNIRAKVDNDTLEQYN